MAGRVVISFGSSHYISSLINEIQLLFLLVSVFPFEVSEGDSALARQSRFKDGGFGGFWRARAGARAGRGSKAVPCGLLR